MGLSYQITKAPWFLYNNGIRYYDCGKISCNGQYLFDYYKVDSITDEQRQAVLAWCPKVQFRIASPQFAPEIRKVAICFPKAAFFRQSNKGF